MRRPRHNAASLIGFLLISPAARLVAQPQPPVNLRVEYLVEPLGIDTPAPRFSWEVSDDRIGERQTAYEIEVMSGGGLASGTADLWDTDKKLAPDTNQIEYAGKTLSSGTLCYWRVRTWDSEDRPSEWSVPARFGVGLLSPSDWTALWIADPHEPTPPLQPRNGFHSQLAASPDELKWVTIDLGQPQMIDRVTLWPARPYDWNRDAPGFMFPIRYFIQASISPDFTNATTLVDLTHADQPNPGTQSVTHDFSPSSARYIRVAATRLGTRESTEFGLALAEFEVYSSDRNVAAAAEVAASDSIEMRQWSTRYLTDGDRLSHGPGDMEALPAVRLRREFNCSSPVTRATAFVSALGLYEMLINGRRVGDHHLAPGWTDYIRRVEYQAYDVTDLLDRSGDNAIAVTLGDGWYAGRIGMAQALDPRGFPRAVYGRTPRFIAQVDLEHADGTRTRIVTDDTWKTSTSGPIRSADMLDGVLIDRRLEQPGWDQPGFNDALWSSARIDGSIVARLEFQRNDPIRVTREIPAQSMNEPAPGVHVFDLGQNMPGVVRLRVSGNAGQEVTIRHAEMLNDDGTLYTANLRGAPSIDRYILRGDPDGETLLAPFTYHGFRYAEVTGLTSPPALSDLTGVVFHSAPRETGSFECSNAMVSKLWENILWTQRANHMNVPTDCPQRDERLGWSGDILAFGQTACFNLDMAAFIAKWAVDVRDAQADDGRYPDFAPHPFGKNDRFTGVPAWGDAGVFVPWNAYENYGDMRLLAQHFESASRWVDWIHSANPDLIWRNRRHNDYNDWLNGDTLIQKDWPTTGGAVPNELFATAFFARSTEIVAQMARALGKDSEAKKYADLRMSIGEAFRANFMEPDGGLNGDTQGGYALALSFGLIPEDLKARSAAHMLEAVNRYDGRMSTGFHTSHRLMLELTRFGYDEAAYGLMTSTRFPSWGYTVENGATSIWERWDGYVKGRGFQDPGMNSFNHYAIGSVGEWMYRAILGINQAEGSVAWKNIILRPRVGGGMTWARGSYHSINGPIESAWKLSGSSFEMTFRIPPGCSAEVHVPANLDVTLTDLDDRDLAGSPAIHALGVRGDSTLFAVPSGSYRVKGRRS